MLILKCLVVVLLPLDLRITEAKRPYLLEAEKIEIVRDPKFLLQVNELRVSKYNSTNNVINANLTFIEDVPDDAVFKITAYQLMASNKYSMIPVGMPPVNFCDMIADDKDFYPTFLAKSNFPEKCPVKKGELWMRNYIPDSGHLPEELPGDRWRVEVDMLSKKRVLAKTRFFVYINRNT